jgi:hypothetical protein
LPINYSEQTLALLLSNKSLILTAQPAIKSGFYFGIIAFLYDCYIILELIVGTTNSNMRLGRIGASPKAITICERPIIAYAIAESLVEPRDYLSRPGKAQKFVRLFGRFFIYHAVAR